MFEKYDLSFKEDIENCVRQLSYKDHNLSFTNMFLWKRQFKLSVHVDEKFIIVLCDYKGEIFSLNPLCTIENMKYAIEFLKDYFKEINKPFIIHNCVVKVKNTIEELYPNDFTYEITRDSFDYLYTVEKLLTYSGKKLQKKRNHLNNFKKNYQDNVITKVIDNQEVINDCIEYSKIWFSNKEVQDEYLPAEIEGTIDVLNNFDKLSCEGLAVYIDGKVVGFGVGTQLNDTTAVINIEKANANIQGLYPYLRQQVVSTFFDDLVYINTEDDVGDENLRKSKLSYQPEYLVEKYTIRLND